MATGRLLGADAVRGQITALKSGIKGTPSNVKPQASPNNCMNRGALKYIQILKDSAPEAGTAVQRTGPWLENSDGHMLSMAELKAASLYQGKTTSSWQMKYCSKEAREPIRQEEMCQRPSIVRKRLQIPFCHFFPHEA
ncbi:hypothetical protein GN956_G969 [Arapaima gigas]